MADDHKLQPKLASRGIPRAGKQHIVALMHPDGADDAHPRDPVGRRTRPGRRRQQTIVFMRDGHRIEAGEMSLHPLPGIVRRHDNALGGGQKRSRSAYAAQPRRCLPSGNCRCPRHRPRSRAGPVRRNSGLWAPTSDTAGRTRRSRGHAHRRECPAWRSGRKWRRVMQEMMHLERCRSGGSAAAGAKPASSRGMA